MDCEMDLLLKRILILKVINESENKKLTEDQICNNSFVRQRISLTEVNGILSHMRVVEKEVCFAADYFIKLTRRGKSRLSSFECFLDSLFLRKNKKSSRSEFKNFSIPGGDDGWKTI